MEFSLTSDGLQDRTLAQSMFLRWGLPVSHTHFQLLSVHEHPESNTDVPIDTTGSHHHTCALRTLMLQLSCHGILIAEFLIWHLRLYRENYPYTRSCQSPHQWLCLWQRWALSVAFFVCDSSGAWPQPSRTGRGPSSPGLHGMSQCCGSCDAL